MPITQNHFTNLVACMDKSELLNDSRFAETAARMENYSAYTAIVADWLQQLTTNEAMAALEAAHVPCARYLSMAEATEDPQLAHRHMIVEIEDPSGPLPVINSPFLFSRTTSGVRPWAARVGQHNREILETVLGYTSERIDALEVGGILASS